jgi:hypothetical protein
VTLFPAMNKANPVLFNAKRQVNAHAHKPCICAH